MSLELANGNWLDGDESGLLGQFASTLGYSDLIAHSQGYPALESFFRKGATEQVPQVRTELEKLAGHAPAMPPADVASTAKALMQLSEGQNFLIITNGAN
jgi:hypothetical protein